MMIVGPVLNSCAIILGGIIGASLSRFIPKRLERGLPATFALSSIAIGITMIIQVNDVTVVVMAFILGTALGELIYLESGIGKAATFIQGKFQRFLPLPRSLSKQDFSLQFTALIILFGASGLGVIGAMTEGLNGDYQLLVVKSLMDFVTAIIFAITLGPSVVLIAIVQFVVQVALFLVAKSIMPYMDAGVYANFSAIGGIIMLAVGLRIAKIMNFAVVNFLPALFLVVPFTYLWRHFMQINQLRSQTNSLSSFILVKNNLLHSLMSQSNIQQTIASFTSIEQALNHFDIEFDSRFIAEYGTKIAKIFNGYLIMQKPDDWFSARRALKNAYCKVQRGRLDRHSRSACRGCTSCQRR